MADEEPIFIIVAVVMRAAWDLTVAGYAAIISFAVSTFFGWQA